MDNDIKVILDSIDDIGVKIDSSPIQLASLEIGETKTGEVGTEAIVTNSGSSARAILNFTIPRGDNGVYIGEDEPTDDEVNVWIDPSGEASGDIERLEQTLAYILEVIQSGELSENQVSQIEELIVSYFENKTVKEVEE